ncbi:MAG: hypothetical protein JKY89_08675 [Immundisolibacteraceae bacterium]|nr:hypothetical protein [Immundisolibacteraceae bacterium]
MAQLTAAMDGLSVSPQRWRADPVSLIPDRDQLVVMPAKMAHLTLAEAEPLVALLNQHFDQEFKIEIAAPHRWYLQPIKALEMQTIPLEGAAGASAGKLQPTGTDAMMVQSWLNEIQMLLHTAEVNQQREATDQLQINSIWIWGNEQQAVQVDKSIDPLPDLLLADPGWAVALAESINQPHQPLPKAADLAGLLPEQGHVMLDLAGIDGSQLAQADWLDQWFEQIRELLGHQVVQLDLYSVDHQSWQLQSWRRRDFSGWKMALNRLLDRFRSARAQATAGVTSVTGP